MTLTEFKDWFFNRYRLPSSMVEGVSNRVKSLVERIEKSKFTPQEKNAMYDYMKSELKHLQDVVRVNPLGIVPMNLFSDLEGKLNLPDLLQITNFLKYLAPVLLLGIILYFLVVLSKI